MPKSQNKAKPAALEKLKQNLETIKRFEANFILQKSRLKKSVVNYDEAKKLIERCAGKFREYAALISIIDSNITGVSIKEKEAKAVLAEKIKDISHYEEQLNELKTNKKRNLYGVNFDTMFKKDELKSQKKQLQECIDNSEVSQAKELNESAEKFISEKLVPSERIISEALAHASQIKISTDMSKHLYEILTEETDKLAREHKELKSTQADSESTAAWVIKWVVEKTAGGAVSHLGGKLTSYITPVVIAGISAIYSGALSNLPTLYRHVVSYLPE